MGDKNFGQHNLGNVVRILKRVAEIGLPSGTRVPGKAPFVGSIIRAWPLQIPGMGWSAQSVDKY
jgi:hypothetical protein